MGYVFRPCVDRLLLNLSTAYAKPWSRTPARTSSWCRSLPPVPLPLPPPPGLLPVQARRSILDIHTRKWSERPPPELLDELAGQCVGYCGADLKAVCAEAALHAVRRRWEGRCGDAGT